MFCVYICVSVYIIFKKERKKKWKVRSLKCFVVIFKERKKESEKERKNKSCDLWLATSKEKRKESRQVVGKAGWCHNRMVSSVFVFTCLTMYLLNLHWQFQGRERKREKVRESLFINDIDNLIYYMKVMFLITITYKILFICWFIF